MKRLVPFAFAAALAFPLGAAPPSDGVARLLAYLRIDTSNPPGNEKKGALFLKSILDAAGIASELDEPAPGRASLYARLTGSGAGPALLLHHHLDVVPAGRAGWRSAPFAAEEEGTRVTARGALDDKALGLAELEAFLALRGRPLRRDVVYLATADEEAGGALGLASVAARRPAWLAGVGFAIGEGGETETVVETQRLFGVEVAQKSALWLRLSASGLPGHSASPDPANAPARLARLLGDLVSRKRPLVVSPLVADALATTAKVKPKDLADLLRSVRARAEKDPDSLRTLLTPRFLALVTDTLVITRLGPEDGAPNAVPAVAFADVDCRLLPSTDLRAFLDEVRRRASAERVDVSVRLEASAGPPSPTPGALYDVIAAVLSRRFPGVLVVPTLGTGTSENRVLRARGVATYGVLPFRASVYDLRGIHGVNERIRTDWYLEGVELMKEIVARFAAR
ncbi:MAG TPA: M20/M25/M40 family metallo-hydrolase [Thermoanaerobaculia bacterium]|nr:M20/M25/M40 family metallo-hydrolase [Thermoanaerobaculia bacterium]